WLTWFGAATLVFLCAAAQWTSYFVLESKPYSGDMFWALLLPALAASVASSSPDDRMLMRRSTIWWTVAALGQWVSNGALLATPACALAVLAMGWRQAGWRGLSRVALPGVVWLAAVGAHYELAIRHTLNNEYLRDYWVFATPPPSSGVAGTLTWLAG